MRVLGLLLSVGVLGCVGGTDAGPAGAPVTGRWAYAATQVTPGPADAMGSLSFLSQTGSGIGGTLDFVETDFRGLQRRIAGPVSGRTVDSTTLDFEQLVDGLSRRHVGTLRKDSIVGSWVELPASGGAISASGTFRAKRAQ